MVRHSKSCCWWWQKEEGSERGVREANGRALVGANNSEQARSLVPLCVLTTTRIHLTSHLIHPFQPPPVYRQLSQLNSLPGNFYVFSQRINPCRRWHTNLPAVVVLTSGMTCKGKKEKKWAGWCATPCLTPAPSNASMRRRQFLPLSACKDNRHSSRTWDPLQAGNTQFPLISLLGPRKVIFCYWTCCSFLSPF